MNLNVTLTCENGRWTATDRDTGTAETARRPDTALGRLVLALAFAGRIPTGGNLAKAIREVRLGAQEGGAA